MSLQALTWAKRQAVGDPLAKLVLLCLADAMNERDGYAFPSQKRLADECEMARSTLLAKLAHLEAKGLIRRERVSDQTGRDTGCRYYFVGVHDLDTGVRHTDTPVRDTDGGGSATRTGGVHDLDTSKGNRKENQKKEPLPPVAPHGFDEFWKAYPLRKAKGGAMKAWAKAILRAPPEEIIAAAARYRPPDPKFTKHPTTWLNQECWTDEPDHHHEPSDPFLDAMRTEVAERQRRMEGGSRDDVDDAATGEPNGATGSRGRHPRLAYCADTGGPAGCDEGSDTGEDPPEQAARQIGGGMAGGYPGLRNGLG